MNPEEEARIREVERFMAYHARRCPGCRLSNFTSKNDGTHRCLTPSCGRRFTDANALPSLAAEDRDRTESA